MSHVPETRLVQAILAQQAPTIVHGHSLSLHIWCPTDDLCPPLCQGGKLILNDISVSLSCEHARNLADRAREAIDATVLGCLPPACGCRLQ